jgi:hypothetical protein
MHFLERHHWERHIKPRWFGQGLLSATPSLSCNNCSSLLESHVCCFKEVLWPLTSL